MDINVLYEDKNIIVIVKPAGIASQPDKTGEEDILTVLQKTNSNIDIIHRLDRPINGVMVFSKNKEATKNLNRQIQENKFEKRYFAVVSGEGEKEEIFEDYLIKNQRLNISRVVNKNIANAKKAILNYKTIKKVETLEDGLLSLLDVELLTGRHHQIRVQLANAHLAIWGDTKYNKLFFKPKEFVNIALSSYYLSFFDVKTNKKREFSFIEKIAHPFNLFY